MIRSRDRRPSRPDLLPVVIGGDIGAYALARQLHDATGQRVVLLSPSPIEAIELSSYIDVRHYREHDEDMMLSLLRELVADRGPRSAVVMANSDATARLLAALARHAGSVLTWADLLNEVWGTAESAGGREMVRTTVYRLRRHLGRRNAPPDLVVAARGQGYTMPRLP